MKELTLEQIAEVQTGYAFRSKVEHDPDGDLCVIQGRDVKPGHPLDVANLTRIRLQEKARPNDKFILRDDVLLMVRSGSPFAVHIDKDLPPTLVQNSFNTLRLRVPVVLPAFLAMVLNQSLMQSRMLSVVRGSTIPYIQVADIRNLTIPVPPLERQHHLVALEQTLHRERELHRQLEESRRVQLDALILQSGTQ